MAVAPLMMLGLGLAGGMAAGAVQKKLAPKPQQPSTLATSTPIMPPPPTTTAASSSNNIKTAFQAMTKRRSRAQAPTSSTMPVGGGAGAILQPKTLLGY